MVINVDDAYELYERIAENQSMWPSDREVPRKTTNIHNVNAVTALTAQMEAITRKLDSLTHSMNMVQTLALKCVGCGVDHITASCPLASTHIAQPAKVSYAQNYQRQNGPYPYNYHPSLNKHPNYTWVENSDQALSVEDVNYATIKTPSIKPATHVQAYVPPIPFPQRLQRHPKIEQVQVITMRIKVQLPEIAVKKKGIEENRVPTSGEEQVGQFEKSSNVNQKDQSDNPQVKATALSNKNTPLVPFLQRLQNNKMDKQFKNFFNTLRQLHINIPFIDAILQIPNYAMFLKEILSKKRKLPEHETIALSEECSAIIQHRIPPKLKDLGSFTLPCSIGNLNKINCLIDSGVSINFIPLPLYRKLGLGDPKAASIILQLADRSLKHPYRIVEDILIKVGEFIFSADFIILDIKEAS
ncbi:uncharacterized protein LOC111392182 [Olea europaea var. sylvestris]|uniref:uncharacterized protein LOC111392182 n=1 Tax=Olea europaea var. sylvestris TaxID=158386 RepID=UPI000C1D5C80|nr:uncharacterized protein LOC111392182 [Olea europaea var. sylvestris]